MSHAHPIFMLYRHAHSCRCMSLPCLLSTLCSCHLSVYFTEYRCFRFLFFAFYVLFSYILSSLDLLFDFTISRFISIFLSPYIDHRKKAKMTIHNSTHRPTISHFSFPCRLLQRHRQVYDHYIVSICRCALESTESKITKATRFSDKNHLLSITMFMKNSISQKSHFLDQIYRINKFKSTRLISYTSTIRAHIKQCNHLSVMSHHCSVYISTQWSSVRISFIWQRHTISCLCVYSLQIAVYTRAQSLLLISFMYRKPSPIFL